MSRIFPRIVRGRPEEAQRILADQELSVHTLDGLTSRDLGVSITDHRTSWVRRVSTSVNNFFVKTYSYQSTVERWRAALRWTGPTVSSRATREFDALRWLQARGLGAVDPIAVVEWRRFGVLHRCCLLTSAWPGVPLDRLLPTLPRDAQREVATALGGYVGRLHRAGFRDRNLDLRNLLARRGTDGSWRVTKIDSPRWRVPQSQHQARKLAQADWDRLLPQLGAAELAAAAQQAGQAP